MMRASYNKGSYPDLDVEWELRGVRVTDLSTRTISLKVFPYGSATAFTKTTGFTVPALNVDLTAPNPNLIVAWSQVSGQELDSLAVDAEYYLLFEAVGISDKLEMIGSLILRQNAPNVGYCEIMDLLLGDLTVAASVNKYTYINSAAAEMDGFIGQRYMLPLDLSLAPDWIALKLKTINQNLATGRLVQALAVAHQDASVNAYGQHLIDSAMVELQGIANGTIALPGLPLEPTSFRTTAPSITNHDDFSAIDQFEEGFMRPRRSTIRKTIWRPGPAMPGEIGEGVLP